MNIKLIFTAIFLLVIGVFNIAVSAIATECYNQDTESGRNFKASKESNFNFLITNLVSASIGIIAAVVSIVLAIRY